MNVRLGGILNGLIHGDDATDITDTKVTICIRQISDEIILDWIKHGETTNLWDPGSYFAAKLRNIEREYYFAIKRIQKILNKTESIEFHNIGGLGASNTL